MPMQSESYAPRGMVRIPAGEFRMGSETGSEAEKPVHAVFLDEFYLDACLVSNADFAQFVEETGYVTTAEAAHAGTTWRTYSTADRLDHPVVLVSWQDASAYARWCGKALPTEAQWERAARAGGEGDVFPWGTEPPRLAGRKGEAPPTRPVTQSRPNSFGLHDMAGNVWQWCADWYAEDYYAVSVERNPPGPESGQYRVRRGGAWNVREAFRLRCANRGAMAPESFWPNLGFRCAGVSVVPSFRENFEKALAELLPAMEPDGGGAEIVCVEGNSAVLRLVGSCLFCPSKALSAAALERGLRRKLPELVDLQIVGA